MSPTHTAEHLLAKTGPILLDFDGPVCRVFAGYSASVVADELRGILINQHASGIEQIAGELDPLQVLRWTSTLERPELVRAVEDALCAAELRAIDSAAPTAYAREVIVAARQAGRPVAIVSNNAAPAVAAYLAAQRLFGHVGPIAGRAYAQPEQVKPNPRPTLRAVDALGVDRETCLLVGDSLTDITGAQAAGVKVIGYANKPAKIALFRQAGAQAVVTSMGEIAAPLIQLASE